MNVSKYFLVCFLAKISSTFPLQESEEIISNISNSHIVLFPDEYYKIWLDICNKNEEMPYFNETLQEYECYPILEQGPCQPNHWFVLDKDQPNYSKCAKNPCACVPSEETNCQIQYDEYEESFNENNYEYDEYNMVEFEGFCQDIHEQGNCPLNQKLLPNPFGIGNSCSSV